jgi:hypothetical protein
LTVVEVEQLGADIAGRTNVPSFATLSASQATESVARHWRIAIHEAGHAVAARLLRLPRCGAATIIEPHAQAAFPTNCGPPSICALMAGAAAETIMLGDYDRGGSKYDWEHARERLERCGYADGGEALWWAYTINLLRPHLSLLTRVAIRLKRAQVLDGGEIDRVVRLSLGGNIQCRNRNR